MRNISHNNKWNLGIVQLHVKPLPNPLIKIKHNDNLDKDLINIKLRRDPGSQKLDLYEFKMSLFNNGNPEEFLLFVNNFNTTLGSSRTLQAGVNIQYLHTLVSGEALQHFDTLSSDVESGIQITFFGGIGYVLFSF